MARKELATLPDEEIFNIHELMIQRDGGLPGLRSTGSLSAVTQRVYNYGQYDSDYRDPWRLSGLLAYAIVMGHPFNDANKRTALVSSVSMLRLNNCSLPEPSALTRLLVAAAAREIDQEAFIKQFVVLSKKRR